MSDTPTSPASPEKQANLTPFVTFIEVTLPSTGQTVKLEKLKAGKYYQAQKIYIAWIQELQKAFSSNLEVDVKELIKEDGTADKNKLVEEIKGRDNKVNVQALLTKINEASTRRMELLEICLNSTTEAIENNYYPEDIDLLMDKVIALNNFMGNLKKSVAPSVGLGA